jgi:PAS domain S-box-containing protein
MTDTVSHMPPAMPASSMPSTPPAKADAAFLETIIGATEEMMWVVDAERFGLLWWNSRVADFLGAMGVSLSMHLTADNADHGGMRVGELHAFYRRALDEGSFTVEDLIGPTHWLGLVFTPLLRDGRPYAVLATAHDITQRKRAELEREEALTRLAEERRLLSIREEEQRLLLRHAPAAIFEVDLTGLSFITVNDYGCEASGYSRDELLALHPLALLDEKSRPILAASIQAVADGHGATDPVEYTLLKKDGTTRLVMLTAAPLPSEGPPVRTLVVGYDITEQKEAEQQLELSGLRYRTVVDNIQEGVVVSSADGEKLYFNDQLPRMLGCTNEEYAAAPLISMVHPEDRGQVEWMQGALFQNGSPISDFEARLVDKEGRVKWVRSKASLTDWLGQQAAVTFMDDVTAQVQAEAALKQSVDIVNSMFKSVQDAFYMATLDEGRFIELNHAFEELFGYARDELVGATGLELGLWVDSSERSRMVEELRRRGHLRDFRAVCKRRSGETFLCAFAMATCDIDGTTCIVGFLRDETERLAAEEALRESEAGYRLLADNMVDVIWMADAESMRFTYISPSCRLLDGYEPEELIGTTITDRATPGLRAERTQLFRSMRERFESQGMPFLDDVGDLEILHKDGTPLWVDVRTRILRDPNTGNLMFLGLTRDKSKQRAAEDALRQKQEQLDRFFSLEVGLLCVSDLDCHFRLVSAGWETALGRPKEEIVGRSVLDFVHPSDLPVTMEAMDRLRAQEEVVDLVNRLAGKDGNYRTISWRCAPAGELVYSAARDVTDLLAAEGQLRQSQKMEAIGQLAGGIAHDFNNLLTAILGYTDLLLASPEGHGEPLRLDLLEIKGAAKRAADLTQQILAFSRKQALRPEVICINDVLSELKPLLERLLGENVMLEVQTAEDLGQCEIDPSQFTQVLINLIVNARDAMPRGGFLIMETANADLRKRGNPPALADLDPGGYVVLKCTDTGSGMDAETVSRIFEPFFTTKPAGEGTGLGLSTVHGIVHQSGGTVLVDSELGRGTVFTIYLPRISAEVTGETGSDEPSRSGRGHGTVLVVEDEESVAALTRRVLVSHGYEVTTAANAMEALGALADTGKIDLLLTDMVLPGGMQGGELADTAKSVHPELGVLYMSGYSRASSIHGGRLSEAVNFLQKPFTPGELVANVEDALAGRDRPAQAEPPPGIDKEAGSR